MFGNWDSLGGCIVTIAWLAVIGILAVLGTIGFGIWVLVHHLAWV